MKQIGSGILKRGLFIKFLFLSFTFAFSIDGFAVVACNGVKTFSAESNAAYLAEAPDSSARYYSVGLQIYCTGDVETGINYMEKASDMGNIPASYVLGSYYGSDKTGNLSKMIPEVQDNYDAAIFYYERVTSLIESTNTYPHGIHTDLPDIEGSVYMSVRAPILLTILYYIGYVQALRDMLKNDVSYTDTIQVLTNMQSAAERCLGRPSLSVWGARQNEIANSKQVICQARKDFAEKVLDLEFQRIEIAKRCDVALSECTEHQGIFQEIVQVDREMNEQVGSVPAI